MSRNDIKWINIMAIEHTYIYKNGTKTKNLTAMKAIREKCLECSGWSFTEVSNCECKTCVLYPFRFGKYPDISVAGCEFSG